LNDRDAGPSVALARAIAAKVDAAANSHSAAMVMALAAASRELRAVLEPLFDRADEDGDAFVASLFAGVDSSALVDS
jgi:hypothetical protein